MNKQVLIVATPGTKKEEQQEQEQSLSDCCLDWVYILLLVLFTFSLIAAVFISCYAISVPNYVTGTSIYFMIFVLYAVLLAAAWYFGNKQKDAIKRRAIKMQLQLQKKALE